MNNLATDMAPPFVLVAHYFIAGAIFYLISSAVLPFFANDLGSIFLTSSIASLSHLYLLGFVMMVIFGAMYQLIPVVLEIPIFSKDFAYIQFYLYVVGIVIFSWALQFDKYEVIPYGAMLIYLSMLIFVANIFLTYKELKTYNIIAKFLLASNVFLFISVTIGIFIAFNLKYGFYSGDIYNLVAGHIAGTIGGYVLMTIMGVAMILLPMFALAHNFSQKPIERAFYIITAGLAIFIIFSLFEVKFLQIIGLILIAIATGFGLYQMQLIFKGRIRKGYDYYNKNMVASFGFLIFSIVIMAIAFLTDSDKLKLLFGFSMFFGFFVFFIVGHIYKILPFLVWFQRYSPLVGKQKVPMLNDMIDEKIADIQFWLTFTGTIIASIAILFSGSWLFILGTGIIFISSILVIYNIYFSLVYGLKDLKKGE